VFPVLLLVSCVVALAIALLVFGHLSNPGRSSGAKRMPYESGMDPIHDTRRRFDIRFHLVAIAFLVFDVELLFLYPWAIVVRTEEASPPAAVNAAASTVAAPLVASDLSPDREPRPLLRPVFVGGMLFLGVLALGYVYDWRKGVFRWR
jgi:NADH-quinone oxidoreductase subunit A